MSQTFSSRGLLPDRKPVSLLALSEGMAVGPVRLVRDLGRCRGAYRWLGRVPSDASLFQVYVVPPAPVGGSMPPAVEAGDRLRGRHIVPILGSGMHESGWTWALSPYAGDIEGVRSLTDVLKMRAGHQMPVYEARVAASQLIDAATDMRRCGVAFADITGRDVLIDRRGAVRVEVINAMRGADTPMRDDTCALGMLVYEMLTGATPSGAFMPPSRLASGVGRAWDRWTERALGREFDSMSAASSAMPNHTA